MSEKIWDFDLREALEEISPQRREQALKFKFEEGQRLCVLAYLLLKQGLREEYGIQENPVFEYNVHGKPAIAGHPEIYFNLSHCKEAAACVISDAPVGIDVESIRAYKDSLARYTMNEEELEQIQTAAKPEAAFIRLWTMKEAALKLIGTGISNDLKSVLKENSHLRFTTYESPAYIYTVCTTT
ncbi:MAG: 4'-phosphopantetheinyl transferase superfamily protein [Prevotella sp.]|nr:4'-phosphopantetheinyl transferase superfamily protein [Prevotella sp.]